MHFIGKTTTGHEIHMDSGPEGAPTQGPIPIEVVLHATAACSAMDVVAILRKRRKEIKSFQLEAEAERSPDHPRVFKNIFITYRVNGDGITRDEVEKAVKLSQEKYCSITHMLKPKVHIEYKVEVDDR